jgi:hypothetical protein
MVKTAIGGMEPEDPRNNPDAQAYLDRNTTDRRFGRSGMNVERVFPSGAYRVGHNDAPYESNKDYYGYPKREAMDVHAKYLRNKYPRGEY